MTTYTALPDEYARYAIAHHEFPSELLGSAKAVAVISTQSWCPDWKAVDRSLKALVKDQKPEDFDLSIYTVIYDREKYFSEYRTMKERIWGNSFVPYIRYYVDGELVADTNQLASEGFLEVFREHMTENAR